jgi:SAM-dependent methyltransferase
VGDPKLTLALSFGRAAQDYERGRPEWPAELVDLAGLDAGATVLDLAAGTGKLTRLLTPRFARVIAVEPHDDMRALIPPGAEVLAGTAEAIPLEDASVDGVFVAEAFHWFDYERAVAELARVLRPGAPLVIVWNLSGEEGGIEPFTEEAQEALDRKFAKSVGPPGASLILSGIWREGFDGAPFSTLVEHRIPFDHRAERDTIIAYILSVSAIAALPDDERTELAAELVAALPDTTFRLACAARVHVTHRL